MKATPLRGVIWQQMLSFGGRYTWRLDLVNGNKASVIESQTAYMTEASAIAGLRRFAAMYLRPDAPITFNGKSLVE